jgi:amidase
MRTTQTPPAALEGPVDLSGLHGLARESMAWDATETRARLVKGEVSALEVVEAAIARADLLEPQLGALVYRDDAGARAAARANGASGSGSGGVFAGVPTFVKDMEALRGMPTRYGSQAVPHQVAAASARSVAQLLSTGLVPLGKSTTAEFGLNATTEPLHGPPTRNPRDRGRSSGGSSGGASALVAAGVVPIAHAGDGGGSIRIPAAFCGLVGLKATRGRLAPMASASRMPVKIATYGVVTRSVRDTAAFFAAVDDQRPAGMAAIGHGPGPGRQPLRVGLFIDPPLGTAVDPEVRAATLAAAAALEAAGHRVLPVAAPYDRQLADDFLTYWGFMAMAVELSVKLQLRGDVADLQPWTRALAARARQSWWAHPGAILRLGRFRHRYAEAFASCDVMLSPTTAGPAPRLGELRPDLDHDSLRGRLLELLPYTPAQNASGGPAISVPFGATRAGLPIGVQLAAPWGEERRLLELAYELEAQGK